LSGPPPPSVRRRGEGGGGKGEERKKGKALVNPAKPTIHRLAPRRPPATPQAQKKGGRKEGKKKERPRQCDRIDVEVPSTRREKKRKRKKKGSEVHRLLPLFEHELMEGRGEKKPHEQLADWSLRNPEALWWEKGKRIKGGKINEALSRSSANDAETWEERVREAGHASRRGQASA